MSKSHKHAHTDTHTNTLSLSLLLFLTHTPAARIYCAPFPGWSSRLLIRVPTGSAPSGWASPSFASTAIRPITDELFIRSPACMFSVAMIQRLRFPPATRAISLDLEKKSFLTKLLIPISLSVCPLYHFTKRHSLSHFSPHVHLSLCLFTCFSFSIFICLSLCL